MEASGIDRAGLLAVSKKLTEQLENGSDKDIEKVLDEVAAFRESSLFQELGKLTRELHDSIRNFQLDDRFNDIAESEIPNAKERLEYVLTMTEKSADTTLTAVEESQPKVDGLTNSLADLQQRWSRFKNKELSADEFRQLAGDMSDFFSASKSITSELSASLNSVLMAQDFQDLSGQIIRQVITLVEDVENNLVNLIRLQGDSASAAGQKAKVSSKKEADVVSKLEGPQVPGLEAEDVMTNQDDVDDLLASLGF
ncbi:MAG: protein phosphatase CheZ [Gammaproteobacteria bacterium]|nr:protein phosphatase CheZ [Gammaproteobacteria bacterium]